MGCILLRQKLCHYYSGAIWEIGCIPPSLEFSLKISCVFSNFFKISLYKIHPSPSYMVVATIDFICSYAWTQLRASADFRNDEISEIEIFPPYLWRAGG